MTPTPINLSERLMKVELETENLKNQYEKIDEKIDAILTKVSDMPCVSHNEQLKSVKEDMAWMKKMIAWILAILIGGSASVGGLKIFDKDIVAQPAQTQTQAEKK